MISKHFLFIIIFLSIVFNPLNSVAQKQNSDSVRLHVDEYTMKSCVRIPLGDSILILNKHKLDSLLRKDFQYEDCQEQTAGINFETHSLAGKDINSGWCRRPEGIAYEMFEIPCEKKYLLKIIYNKPKGVCRALSTYNLWLITPKLNPEFVLEIETEALETED